jgi:hypothetical protein
MTEAYAMAKEFGPEGDKYDDVLYKKLSQADVAIDMAHPPESKLSIGASRSNTAPFI